MRQAKKPNPQQVRVTQPYTVPAPTGGLNARESFSNMPETDCIQADNIICDTDAVRIRKGHKPWAPGLNGNVESLMEWNGPGASIKMFAACASSNSVFEVTNEATGVSSIAGAGLTNARWQHVNFGNGTGTNFLVACNGADPVKNFNGSSWSEPSITASGATSSKFIHVTEHKERLFFTQASSTSVWYLPVNSIAGVASRFDFGSMLELGGHISSCFSWTIDGGNGVDDYFCAYSSKGEVVVYSGSNPGSASDWAKSGTFRMGAPIGRRNFFRVGGDVIMITEDGFMPVSKGLTPGRTAQQDATSDKIRDLVRRATEDFGDNFGWQAILYPKRALGIFNIPRTSTGSGQSQYIVNTMNMSWSQWLGMEAGCWSLMGKELYFGGKGVVYEYGTTAASAGGTIQADIKPAFSYMGSRSGEKIFHMARPILVSTASINPAMVINTDYDDFAPSNVPSISVVGSDWDVTSWDTDFWAGKERTETGWVGVNGTGFCGTLRMRILTDTAEVAWHSTDYLFEKGEFM
jgi:hypothetical protein